MSVESNIKDTDNFFVGEKKYLYWDVADIDSIAGWTLHFTLTSRRGGDPLITKTPAIIGPVRCRVTIDPTDTEDLDAGTYSYILRRLDVGYEQVLAFGIVVLRAQTGVA